ncbi:hypothetical protein L1887_04087 [Cichorium endivia]|nr:hypothetical protein L1887_04087 [Cichorium endivia]
MLRRSARWQNKHPTILTADLNPAEDITLPLLTSSAIKKHAKEKLRRKSSISPQTRIAILKPICRRRRAICRRRHANRRRRSQPTSTWTVAVDATGKQSDDFCPVFSLHCHESVEGEVLEKTLTFHY